jgi:hypothetical protein
MTFGNMLKLGVRSLDVSCRLCHYRAIFSSAPTRGRTGASSRRERA